MANSELNDKRSQAIKLTRGATRKISRLKTKVDVIVAGTTYDPRKPAKLVQRYTGKQLDAYIARVSQFNNRGTQFVPDAHHRPIPASEWRDYKQAENAHRAKAQAEFDRIKDIKLPGRPETVGQRRDQMRSDRKTAGNPSVTDPFDPKQRESKQVASRTALKKLTKDEKRKSARGWDDRELKRQIGEFTQIATTTGDKALQDAVKKLTPGQFKALWTGTGFATAISTQYELARLRIAGKDRPEDEELQEDAFADARRLVEWARTLNL